MLQELKKKNNNIFQCASEMKQDMIEFHENLKASVISAIIKSPHKISKNDKVSLNIDCFNDECSDLPSPITPQVIIQCTTNNAQAK